MTLKDLHSYPDHNAPTILCLVSRRQLQPSGRNQFCKLPVILPDEVLGIQSECGYLGHLRLRRTRFQRKPDFDSEPGIRICGRQPAMVNVDGTTGNGKAKPYSARRAVPRVVNTEEGLKYF
jgi:hypothetical protein